MGNCPCIISKDKIFLCKAYGEIRNFTDCKTMFISFSGKEKERIKVFSFRQNLRHSLCPLLSEIKLHINNPLYL